MNHRLEALRNRIDSHIKNDKPIDKFYDVIVVGVGSMGAAACYYMSLNGLKVLGLEKHNLVHEHGSHTGGTRIIRKAYFEHSDYVPILQKAYQNWYDLETKIKDTLFFKTGLLYMGHADHPSIVGVKGSAELYDIPIESLSTQQCESRFPQFNIPDSFVKILEPEAGFILTDLTIMTFADLALQAGATIRENETFISYEKDQEVYTVKTSKGNYKTKKIVFTAGAMTGDLIPILEYKLTPTKQFVGWAEPKDLEMFATSNFPCWTLGLDGYDSIFYGFPYVESGSKHAHNGLKIGHHTKGLLVIDAQEISEIKLEESNLLQKVMEQYIPNAFKAWKGAKMCKYTYTEDENFIIDFLPDHDQNIVIACGFSGHGFKFVPVIGEIISDLVIKQNTGLPIDFLKMR